MDSGRPSETLFEHPYDDPRTQKREEVEAEKGKLLLIDEELRVLTSNNV